MSNQQGSVDIAGDGDLRTVRERVYRYLFFACAAVSVLTTIGIVFVLITGAIDFFQAIPPSNFFLGTEFSPGIQPISFGVIPLIVATLMITIGSAFIALPLGVLTAIYLSEYASTRARSILKPMLEILAGIPTIIYGYFALVYITPALNVVINWLNGTFGLQFPNLGLFNALSASIVVGIMIIPMVASISEDAMSSVPDSLREASYGLGATKYEVSITVVVPAAISGIASSFILAISRAIGETMAVTVAAGQKPVDLPAAESLFGIPYYAPADLLGMYAESASTMTAQMVSLGAGDASGLKYQVLFAIGITLFVITLMMNVISDLIARRYREEYE